MSGDQGDPDASDDSATETTTVDEEADLEVQVDDADPVVTGSDVTYTLTVTNHGPSDATGVVMTDDVPAGTSFVSADNGGIETAGTVTWNLGSLADGASVTVHVTVHVDEARRPTHQHRLGEGRPGADPEPSRRLGQDTTVAESADLSITKSDDADPVLAGEDLTYTLVVTNDGPSDARLNPGQPPSCAATRLPSTRSSMNASPIAASRGSSSSPRVSISASVSASTTPPPPPSSAAT